MTDLSNSDVTTKYQEASKIANLALQGVVQQCMANARVNDLCKFGDTVIEQVRYGREGVLGDVSGGGVTGAELARRVISYVPVFVGSSTDQHHPAER